MTSSSSYCEPGTLPPPGPVGRLVRLLLGLLCMWFVLDILLLNPAPMLVRFPLDDGLWPWAFAALYLFSYLINIGYGLTWRRWPQAIVLLSALILSTVSRASTGDWFGSPLAWFVLIWLSYTYAHLGLSFLLSAWAATPGCEMRAMPHLLARLRGRAAKEHRCPVGPLRHIDAWEQRRRGE